MRGNDLRPCQQCGQSFTATNWRLHAHNANQARCEALACRDKAVGFCEICAPPGDNAVRAIQGGMLLCGPHLLTHRRNGHAVRIVDGSICRVCSGAGQQHAIGTDPDKPAGQWLRCPHCQGTGYDPDTRPRSPRLSPFAPPRPHQPPSRPQPSNPQPGARQPDRIAAEAEAARAKTDKERLEAWKEQVAKAQEAARAAERATAAAKAQEPARAAERPPAATRAQEAVRAAEKANAAARKRKRPPLKRRRDINVFLLQAAAVALTGAAVGALFAVPLLPDAAAEQIIALQDRVRELLR